MLPKNAASTSLYATKSSSSQIKKGTAILCMLSLGLGLFANPQVEAATDKNTPSGTLLLPLTPKLDVAGSAPSSEPTIIKRKAKANDPLGFNAPTGGSIPFNQLVIKDKPDHGQTTKQIASKTTKKRSVSQAPVQSVSSPAVGEPQEATADTSAPDNTVSVPGIGPLPVTSLSAGHVSTARKTEAEDPDLVNLETENENSLLKGTVQIVADDTEYDQNKNTFLGTGNAIATIGGQNSRLEADMILYDQNSQVMDARGNVKIIRQGEISTGSAFKFKVTSDEYMITNPDTEVNGTQVIARTGMGSKAGMSFKNGTLTTPTPIHIARNPYFGTLQSSEETLYKTMHPDAYVPEKPSYVFKARKMVYEKYKEQGNVTIFGGRVCFGKFSIPLGKFVATVGKETRVVFPVSPGITNNLQMGGLNVGPKFSYGIGKEGVFYWMPMIQSGGRRTSGANEKGSLGVAMQTGYLGKRLTAQLAYGSNSNLLVGTVKYIINNQTQFQSGINKFLPDGLFGANRARAIAEVVNTRFVGGVPFITGFNFRTSAGWMSDQPSLLNLTPQYKQLFTMTNGNITSGYRIQEQILANSEPIFALGDKKYGVRMNIFGGVAGKAYSTGDSLLMGQIGPILNVNLNRARLQGMVTKSGVRGQSPFVFDQFIQGSKSASLSADVKVCKWLTLGTSLAYNLDVKMLYQRSFSCAIGPDDFKVLLSRDTLRGINRFGFDVLYGAPIPFNKLVLKGTPDHGQLGGI